MSEQISPYLFAYGFLKRHYHGNEKTQTPDFEHKFISSGTFTGRLYRVDIYPGVIYDTSAGTMVHGEIFELNEPEKALRQLDRYENALPLVNLNPDYERRLRPVKTASGILQCWVYEYLKPINPATKIESGIF